MSKVRALRLLASVMGYACVAIGLFHVLGGNLAIPGATSAGATVDSLGRFLGAIFAGYGIAWLWAGRQSTVPAAAVRLLTAVFFLGALGRLLSLAVEGRPHWFQLALGALELVMSPVLFWLADADESAQRGRTAEGVPPAAAPHTSSEG
ncbi:hypothetical protein DSC45_08710 [Streptomyces sp. YIM 130001]|uniref:DUF4345 domain-containing protein n=1 Tax=Streptomyces sp. YIM 130001 TaxID=2259644 RepID=UPI000E646E1A|nr:DUF4345 domain-containing protein [Streptomyces sp. YIM 130001]RII18687.1 hypothetical protein DSC45_08710 [Streptomyces sp. YIM 130001]